MTSTAARCNSARTLYLGGATVKQVACSDAALVITEPNSSVRRYPVARLSRIVCSAQVNWQGAALALCMRSGIPIVWADAHSQLLGICYSQHQRQQAFSQALELLLEGENGLSQYTHWLRSRRMDMLMDWARTTALDVTPARWESLKRSWVYHNELAVHLSLQIRTYCQAWVAQRLIHHQINPVYWGVQAECAAALATLRVDAARNLLVNTSLPFAEIAERTGFGTAEHLSAMVRRLTGQTPGKIRGAG